MSNTSTSTENATTNSSRTITPIDGTDGRFEWYQYNEDLRIIHCVEDDTFHAGSILRALGSKKLPKDWARNKQTIELLSGFSSMGEFSSTQFINEKETFNHIHCIKRYLHPSPFGQSFRYVGVS